MKINAVIRTDDDERMFAEISQAEGGLLIEVISDNGNMHQSMRDQVRAWAVANGHDVGTIKMEGLDQGS